MIPKKIHYCWFGRNPLPASALRCISSWRKFLPDYEIKEWNEDNFDVNIIPYTQQAYEAKKYAFVSDYARFWILYHYGGLYFDTDVEIIDSLDEIIERGPFMGIEQGASIEGKPMVNPGLGLGIEAMHLFYKRMLDIYNDLQFWTSEGKINPDAIVKLTTWELYSYGMKSSEMIQNVCGIWIYPSDYFCPMNAATGITTLTERTVSIHHYDASWIDHNNYKFKLHLIKNALFRIIGAKSAQQLLKIHEFLGAICKI